MPPKEFRAYCETCCIVHDATWLANSGYAIHPRDGLTKIDGSESTHKLTEVRATGHRDCQKNPVFHGDILRYKNPKYPKKIQPLHLVLWDAKRASFILRTKHGVNGIDASFHKYPERWQVIASFFTHPDLVGFTL